MLLGQTQSAPTVLMQVELFFKSRTYPDAVEDGDGWHTFLKKGA